MKQKNVAFRATASGTAHGTITIANTTDGRTVVNSKEERL